MTPVIDDEILMAYADGELEPAMAAVVEQAVAADPALGARVALFHRTRETVAEAARHDPAPPIPEALVARVREHATATDPGAAASNVRPLRPLAASALAPRGRLALAASIALAVGLGTGLLVGRERTAVPGLQIAALADPALEAALGTLPSGARTALSEGGEFSAIASFRGRDGEFCREFEYDRAGDGATVVAVACHEAEGWNVRFAVVAAATPQTGYAPASSLEALDAYLASTEAGQPLSLDEEEAALAGL